MIKKNNNKKKERRKFLSDYSDKNKEYKEIYNGDNLIEKILNGKKIKYEYLNELIPKLPKGIDTITLYIDLYSIINQLYNPVTIKEIHNLINERNKFLISSHLINTAAHFRRYFATRRSCYTNIIFFYSNQKSINEVNIYNNYRKEYYDKRLNYNNLDYGLLNKNLKSNLRLCEVISDYLPHVYFINTKEINPIVVPYHFDKGIESNEISILYTSDKIMSLNLLYSDDMNLLYNNKFENYFINDRSDLFLLYTEREIDKLNNKLLPYLYSISGYKKYNINGVDKYGPIKTCNEVLKLINDNYLSNIKYNKSLFIDDLKKSNKFNNDQLNIISRNIELFDIETIYNKLNKSDKLKIFNCKDLQNIKDLINIDNEYYRLYPLNLEDLLLGEDYESIT